MKLESPRERLEAIRQRVEEDLKDHVVTVYADTGKVQCWKCARPNSWMYGFFVTVVPRYVFVAGDIGEVTFQPTHPDPRDFITQGDVHYQYGKATQEFRDAREVSPYLVREVLSQSVSGYRENGRRLPELLKELCRDMRDEAYEPGDVNEFYRRLMDVDPDAAFDFSVTVPSHGVMYRTFALQWFGRWLAQQQGKKAA